MKKQELLIKSREAMLSAVQIYNNPQITFKSETFISLAVISWTYLLHTYYANNGIDYRYYKMKGSRKYYDRTKHGAYKHWELERCLDDKNSPIDSETTNNLKFLIGIRHEIEHQMTNKIDESISAKLQACSINYNYYIKNLFGKEYGVDNQLGFAIQFSPVTLEQKKDLLNNSKLTNNVKNFISEFEENLKEEDVRSPKYAYRLLFTPLNANRKGQADKVIEFLKSGTEGSEQLNKAYAVIKETEKKKYRAKDVVQIMHDKGYTWFNTSMMTDYWKNTLGSRENYGILLSNNQWFWYENWIPIIEAHCRKTHPTIKPESIKNGYYASEIVSEMVQLGYENFTMNSFVKFWRNHMNINKNNTKYGYSMPNNRFVWTDEFFQLVKKYCEDNKMSFIKKE